MCLVGGFHEHCAAVVTEGGGTIDRLLSDGVLAYFGYPQADEHQAERAVRAALSLIEAAGWIDTGQLGRLQVRVGVATGLAVVGGPSSVFSQPTALGEAANLAASLAFRAEPDAVLISSSTRRLLEELFELRARDPIGIGGADAAVEAWQITGEAVAESRFDALRGPALAPLVGREEELELLLRRWNQVQAGSGKAVLISGELGIGKSRLTRVFQDAIAGQPHSELRFCCSPHHQDSAFHPHIAQLERAFGFTRDETSEAKLGRLDAVLAQSDATDEAAAFVSELLSIETDQRTRIQQMTPQLRRDKSLAALLTQLAGLAARQPVLVIYEDVHWIDPSSRELLDRTVELLKRLPALLLVTFRPAGLPERPWRWQQELDLQMALVPALAATKGQSAVDVGGAVARASVLAELIDRPQYLMPLSVSQWGVHLGRSEHRPALSLLEQIDKLANARNDVAAQLQARRMHGLTHFYIREFVSARTILERCYCLSDPAYRAVRGGMSGDPYALMLSHLAVDWFILVTSNRPGHE